MADPIPLRPRQPSSSASRAARVLQAVEDCRDISERARAMGLGLVAYPVDDVELLIMALTGGGRPVA